MIYLYSIIEGLFFTDFFSHSRLRLRNLRKTAHLSQEQTALDANTTPAYLKILQF